MARLRLPKIKMRVNKPGSGQLQKALRKGKKRNKRVGRK